MTHTIEYVVAGGPLHGTVVTVPATDRLPTSLPIGCPDGGTYTVAAYRRAPGSGGSRFVLLHPKATGMQFLTMLAEAARLPRGDMRSAAYAD